MLERELEHKFVSAVKSTGGKSYKFVSPGNSGVPDRIIVLPGAHVGFIELKQKGKTPTKLQQRQIQSLQHLGCYTAVLDDPDDITQVLQECRTHKSTRGDTL